MYDTLTGYGVQSLIRNKIGRDVGRYYQEKVVGV